jgi:Tol biopolymer transport system component
MFYRRAPWFLVVALLGILGAPAVVEAQYFGRNKVQYRTFDFQILKTEHFDLYFYPEEREAAGVVARLAERWHSRFSRFFGHDLRGRQPIILYAVGAHFRQTNAIEGLIGEGTGGVTEALKRRIVLPMSGSLADTDHVLGHEMVHAFQFDLTGEDPRDGPPQSAPGILSFPLWFVEGMAEYLSLGPVDPQTTMWLRDAAIHEHLPSLSDLDDWKYFPYRWGHAFWAYVGAKYGDRAVASLIRSAANPRFDLVGLMRQLGTDPDTFTREWHDAIRLSTMNAAMDDSAIESEPRLVIGKENGGRYNVGPKVSPDGKSVVFFSQRDQFSIELFLANVETGKVERKLLKSATDPHFDSLEFLNSAGAWSPDGRDLAITAVRGGRPVLVIIDPRSGGVRREITLSTLDDAINPAYAPDGKTVIFSGNRGGLYDLYRLTLDSGSVDALTQDAYADLEPVLTPDGRAVVFVTERYSTNLDTLQPGPFRLARLDLATKTVTPIAAFLDGKHISPQISADGRTLTFIADPDGISNLYRMPIDGGPIERISTIPTGVAGITTSSPALSSARDGRLVFSVFDDGGHAVFVLDPKDTVALVAPPATRQAAVLPGRTAATGDIARLLGDYGRGLPPPATTDASVPYKNGLTLDSLGQPTGTVGFSDYGTFVGGSMSAMFSDMLGDRSLGVAAQVSGKLADLGGQLVYINRRHRWNWAASIEQTPYRVGYLTQTVDANGNLLLNEVIDRQTTRGIFGTTTYPFNSSSRLEFTGGGQALTFTRDVRVHVYEPGSTSEQSHHDISEQIAAPLYLGQASAAYVHDSSYFGATAPVYGTRYRVEFGQSVGTLQYETVIGDYRRYFMPVRPFTIAVRGLHYGRFGRDAEHPQIVDLYLGYPEFVHGYGIGSFTGADCLRGVVALECSVFNNLIGTRMAVTNLEVRAPLRGLFKGGMEYGRLPIDVAFFADAGLAWSAGDKPVFLGGSRQVVRSIGGAIRFNLLGILVVESSIAHPFDRPNHALQWQVGVRQGF